MNVRMYKIAPLQMRFHFLAPKRWSTSLHNGILWSKLPVWQLEDYEKVVMMDSDMIELYSIEELSRMPEFWEHGAEKRFRELPRLVNGGSALNIGITVFGAVKQDIWGACERVEDRNQQTVFPVEGF
ncbi:hypothetical protein BJ742DRAFT_781320 [Cladochytrium replicatum]|nr:hypothetical protein BJ742DRAFT_781320 [Cladochytrium replicatum]